MSPRAAVQTFLWLVLAGWLGSFALFPFVAVVAFRTLPSTEVAGQLISPLLGGLHLFGAGAGIALALLARGLGRGRIAVLLPLGLATLCLYSHFGVTAEISEIREQVFGAAGNEVAAARFQTLHNRSMAIFAVVTLGAGLLVGVHSNADPGA